MSSPDHSEATSAFPLARLTFADKCAQFLRAPLRGKFRRARLALLRPGYVRTQQSKRRGHCLQCGQCCRLVWRCPFLSRDNRCRIYGVARPANCSLFPIDRRDIEDLPAKCGYYFTEVKRKKPKAARSR